MRRLDPSIRARLTRPLRLFGAGLRLEEEIVEVGLVAGHPTAKTAKAIYQLDDRGRIVDERELSGDDGISDVPSLGRRLDAPIDETLKACAVLGGSGFPLAVGDVLDIIFVEKGVYLVAATREGDAPVPWVRYEDVVSLKIAGAGTVSTGDAFMVDEFGLEGTDADTDLAGDGTNPAATTIGTSTVVELTSAYGEVFLLYRGDDPQWVRIRLSSVFTRLRSLRARGGIRTHMVSRTKGV